MGKRDDKKFCVVLPQEWRSDGTLAMLQEVLNGVSDGVYFVDRDRKILLWNRGAQELSGFSSQEVVGRCCADNLLQHVDDQGRRLCTGHCPLTDAMETGISQTSEVYLHHKQGFRKPVAVRVKPVFDEKGEIVGAVETFSDNTKMRSAAAEIERLKSFALYDPIAGIGNKSFIECQLRSALSTDAGDKFSLAVLLVRLMGLREIAQRHGAEIGNEAVRVMAQTLTGSLRAGDSLGHCSEEDFVALLLNARENEARAVAQRSINLIRQSSMRFAKFEMEIQAYVSGTCMRRGDTVESVLRRAEELQHRVGLEGAREILIA
jgi:diguanylate cyclase (GGDEF)-like protein/PAS domain S-box-containing protein